MSKYLIGAAAAAIMTLGASGAWADPPEFCSGEKAGWTASNVGGGTTTTCYAGGSGNEKDCESPGNHVVVTVTSEGYTILTNPAGNQSCIVPGSVVDASCDIERSNGSGSTNFGYCG